jgi:hypothetical protein
MWSELTNWCKRCGKDCKCYLTKEVNQKHGGFVSSFYGKFQKIFNENENDLKRRFLQKKI